MDTNEPTVNNVTEPQTDGQDVTENQQTDEPKFTQKDVDRIVGDRLKREEAKKSKELEKAAVEAVENYKKEQENNKRLSKMSEDERFKEEIANLKRENAELMAKQRRAEMTAQARQELAKDGYSVPDNMLSLIVTDDEESTLQNMTALKGYADELRKSWESERAKGVTPQTATQPAEPLSAFDKKLQEINQGRI